MKRRKVAVPKHSPYPTAPTDPVSQREYDEVAMEIKNLDRVDTPQYTSTVHLMVTGGRQVDRMVSLHGADSPEVAGCLDRWTRIITANEKLLGYGLGL